MGALNVLQLEINLQVLVCYFQNGDVGIFPKFFSAAKDPDTISPGVLFLGIKLVVNDLKSVFVTADLLLKVSDLRGLFIVAGLQFQDKSILFSIVSSIVVSRLAIEPSTKERKPLFCRMSLMTSWTRVALAVSV